MSDVFAFAALIVSTIACIVNIVSARDLARVIDKRHGAMVVTEFEADIHRGPVDG